MAKVTYKARHPIDAGKHGKAAIGEPVVLDDENPRHAVLIAKGHVVTEDDGTVPSSDGPGIDLTLSNKALSSKKASTDDE